MADYERIKSKITKIKNMAYPELCAMFAELFNGAACPTNTRTLRNRLIYKVQEMHLGGITTSDMQLLMSLIENDGTPQKQSSATPEATSVIHYVREWKGKKYDVTEVSENAMNWMANNINPCQQWLGQSREPVGTENYSLELHDEKK